LSNKTYFNYGGQGPLPQVALEAIQEGYTYLETEGPFGVVTNDWVTQAAQLVVLSHILWNTGQVLPLKAIIQHCHHHSPGDRPIAVLVDGAQSVGVLPLNLAATEVDFYAFTGHKWWCGPAGLGGLYVRPGTLNSQDFAALQPTFIAWRGIRVDDWGQPQGWQATAQRFELATSAYPLLGGIQKAIATHHQWGTVGERYQRICSVDQLVGAIASYFQSVETQP